MKETQHRRQRSRHSVRWKAAIVFNTALGRPVVHTQTKDLSSSGAAVFSEYGDLTGTEVTLLLAHPSRDRGEAPRTLKARARVVSTVRMPGMANYRHGLSFIRSPHDGLEVLDDILKEIPAQTPRPEPVVATPVAPALSTSGSRLERLKHLAQAKLAHTELAEGNAIGKKTATNEEVSDALRKTYLYLKDLVAQLNVLKPAYHKGYVIAGVPEFKDLAWESGEAEFHTRELSFETKYYDRVSLRFVLSGNRQITVDREYPASEKLRRFLTDSRVEFTAREIRNARGSIERIAFDFPCKVIASMLLTGQYDSGRLLLRTSNVSGFGLMEQVLAPEAITDESLDELAGFILGEAGHLGPLLMRNA